MLSNAIRGHMAELGIVSAKGRNGTAELLAILANEQDDRIPIAAHLSLDVLARQYAVLTTEIGAIEKRIHAWHRSRPTAAGDSWGGSNRGHGLDCRSGRLEGVLLGSRFSGLDRVQHRQRDSAKMELTRDPDRVRSFGGYNTPSYRQTSLERVSERQLSKRAEMNELGRMADSARWRDERRRCTARARSTVRGMTIGISP